ncbi:MAG: chitobiase/beta-hexosaminidase C-terminal domain-containing protein, partial [Paludibacter sp.]|nr:chitobiase/beta-hexosaminidase C-terminal domain-containing protein [Paludibacter sp.]
LTEGTSDYAVNAGTDNETHFLLGGGTAWNKADGKGPYSNPGANTPFLKIVPGANGNYVEGYATSRYITEVKINGTESKTEGEYIYLEAAVLFSDKTPFDETSVTGHQTFIVPANRSGNTGAVFSNLPAGTRSFRVYNPAILSGNALNIAGTDTVGVGNDQYRLVYAKVVLGDVAVDNSPSLTKTSGNNIQSVLFGVAIAPITYKYGGTATSANLTWTTATPAGITVTPDAAEKTVTIAGTPSAVGVYSYSITATDGANTTSPQTGTITVNTPSEPPVNGVAKKLAYITNITNPTAVLSASDSAFVNTLKPYYTVTWISSTDNTADYSPYDVVVLSAVPNSNDAGINQSSILPNISLTKPFVNMKSFELQSSRWNWGTPKNSQGNGTWCTQGDDTLVTVVPAAANHPLFNDINYSGAAKDQIVLSRHAASTNSVVSFELSLAGVEIVPLAYAGSTTVLPSYFEIPVGSVINGIPTANKHIVLGLSESSWNTATADAKQLLLNAVNYVVQPGKYVKQWNFTRYSDATAANLAADTLLADKTWYVTAGEFTNGIPRRFKNFKTLTANTNLTANNIEIAELAGIQFWAATKDNLTIRNNYGDNGIQLGSDNKTVKITGLQAGQYLTVVLKSSNTTARGISAVSSNLSGTVGTNTYSTGGIVHYQFDVLAGGDATFTYSGGIIVKQIIVNEPTGDAPVAPIPTITIARNASNNEKTVTLVSSDATVADVVIRYTLDGADPTETSTLYSAPFTFTASPTTVKARIYKAGFTASAVVSKDWTDPAASAVFDYTYEYYIYSHGVDEGSKGKLENAKYLRATSATDIRWEQIEDSATSVPALVNAKWKLSDVGGLTKIKNVSNNAYIAKGTIAYTANDGTEATIASLVLNETGDGFYIVENAITVEKKAGTTVYIIYLSDTDTHCFEINNGEKVNNTVVANPALVNTIQINNSYADAPNGRSRWHWVIEAIPGTNSVTNPNFNKTILSEHYFDVMGRQVTEFTANVVIIKKITYTDGTVESQKLMILK